MKHIPLLGNYSVFCEHHKEKWYQTFELQRKIFYMALETQQKKSHTKIPLQSGDIVSSSGSIQQVMNIRHDSKGNYAEMEIQKCPLPKSIQLHVKVDLL